MCSSDTASITVTVSPKPTASISGNITVCSGQSSVLTAKGGGNYFWNTGETTAVISVAQSVTTIYCVTVADTNNCTNTACLTVTIESLCCDTTGTFFFPNAFSPNGDGENDSLRIYYNEMTCIKTLHLIIYQRWGEEVFETADPHFQWDGGYNGSILNTQVLAYYLSVKFTNGKEINRKGNISLVR